MTDTRIREVRRGSTVEIRLVDHDPGRTGQLSVEVLKLSDDTVAIAATTTGVTELDPPSGNYTKTLTIPVDLELGDYYIQWEDDGEELLDDDYLRVRVGFDEPAEYTPLMDDVAVLLRARTKDQYGTEVGVFNTDTRPNEQQVREIIRLAVADISTYVGSDVPDTVIEPARHLATLRAAMLVESTYFPEQAAQDNSVYSLYEGLYTAGITRLDALLPGQTAAQGITSVPVTTLVATPWPVADG